MRGSVWVYLLCYLTNRRGNIFGKDKVYGYSETRPIDTLEQQRAQFNRAINKALATYRNDHNLDSDTEVGYTLLRDGITRDFNYKGKTIKVRERTMLTSGNKRSERRKILRAQYEKQKRELTKEDIENMYAYHVTEKEYKIRQKRLRHSSKNRAKPYYS